MISDSDVVMNKLICNPNNTQESEYTWSEIWNKNVRDYKVPGVLVFCEFTWMFAKFLTSVEFGLIKTVFSAKV